MIVKWQKGDPVPWDLLLEADPDRKLVDSYFFESVCLLLVEGAVLQGEVVLKKIAENKWEILNLCVGEAFQKQGKGEFLLKTAFDWIKQEEANSKVTVMIRTGDISPARKLYEKVGFQVIKTQKNYFLENYPEAIFEDGVELFHQVIMEQVME